MPKISKTVRSTSVTRNTSEGFLNMVKSIASAVGASYLAHGDSGNSYYVLMDNIGYPGWCLSATLAANGASIDIQLMTASSEPNYDSDSNRLSATINGIAANTTFLDYNPVTCTVFRDDSNDTVGISVNSGSTEDGSDTPPSGKIFTFKAFFAKDVNDDVLCGLGPAHISGIRTKDSKAEVTGSESNTLIGVGLATCLHLTKMVNYLSPGYPEMKNAYVSLIRPESPLNAVEFNKAFYASGARWGLPGFYPERLGAGSQKRLFEPFEPFIKY